MGIINWPKYQKYPDDHNFFAIYYNEKWDCDGFWRTPSISDDFGEHLLYVMDFLIHLKKLNNI